MWAAVQDDGMEDEQQQQQENGEHDSSYDAVHLFAFKTLPTRATF